MSYYIAVFSSRTANFAFYDLLRKNGVSCQIINTPNKAQVGCGVCVKFAPTDFEKVKKIQLQNREFATASYYRVLKENPIQVIKL